MTRKKAKTAIGGGDDEHISEVDRQKKTNKNNNISFSNTKKKQKKINFQSFHLKTALTASSLLAKICDRSWWIFIIRGSSLSLPLEVSEQKMALKSAPLMNDDGKGSCIESTSRKLSI